MKDPAPFDIVWTSQTQKELLTDEEKRMAFRDTALEVMTRRMFYMYIQDSRRGDTSFTPESIQLKDPYVMPESVQFHKKVDGLLDINFNASSIKISGLQDLVIEQFYFVRHVGRTITPSS